MREMFRHNQVFNQDIGGWDVGNVRDFYYFMNHATTFDRDISSWNTSSATSMNNMFGG